MQSIMRQLFVNAGVHLDIAETEQGVWQYLEQRQQYHLIVVARSELHEDNEDQGSAFVSRLRQFAHCATVPLMLLVSDKKRDACQHYYTSGFTQVLSQNEFDFLQDYLTQLKGRNTFEQIHDNKVVIIEDDYSQRLFVEEILKMHHCRCFCFRSAEEALACADDIDPHMVVCDFYLHGQMTALDFIIQAKHHLHPWRYVPVMVMTALHDVTRKHELVKAGANEYIAKPLDPMELAMRTENLLRYKHLLDEVEQQRKDMQFLAMHDHLTGLYNRYFLSEQVQLRISEAKRHRIPYSMIIIDVDHFKKVNDNYGHDMGDKVLQMTALLLKDNTRAEDVAARLGGKSS